MVITSNIFCECNLFIFMWSLIFLFFENTPDNNSYLPHLVYRIHTLLCGVSWHISLFSKREMLSSRTELRTKYPFLSLSPFDCVIKTIIASRLARITNRTRHIARLYISRLKRPQEENVLYRARQACAVERINGRTQRISRDFVCPQHLVVVTNEYNANAC